MKNKIFIATLGAMLLLAQQPANGQLIINGSNQNWFGQPDNTGNSDDWTRSIGIGYFGSNYTNSILHVDGNNMILPQNNSILNLGEVFRTDSPDDENPYWRMLRNGNQIGYIWNNQANNHFNIQAHQTNGNIDFYTSPSTAGTGVLRMTILPDGKVGIGTPSPRHSLEVNGAIAAHQILIITDSHTHDLLAMIMELQREVNALKASLSVSKQD